MKSYLSIALPGFLVVAVFAFAAALTPAATTDVLTTCEEEAAIAQQQSPPPFIERLEEVNPYCGLTASNFNPPAVPCAGELNLECANQARAAYQAGMASAAQAACDALADIWSNYSQVLANISQTYLTCMQDNGQGAYASSVCVPYYNSSLSALNSLTSSAIDSVEDDLADEQANILAGYQAAMALCCENS